jgi:hypothetical protein
VTTTKIAEFKGTLPRVSPELLPGTAAQIAQGVKLYSGDLIPTPEPVVFDSAERTGTIRTLYALRDPNTSALKWLTWTNAIDIATPAADELAEQRFYYTGDGNPKVSTYALATAGLEPYPAIGGYYDLGLPLPTATPTATPTSFSTVTSASFARDGGGNVTLVTGTAHNLKDGALVTVSGFSYRTGTYSRSAGTTITVTINNHGLVTGTRIYIEFTSGAGTTNAYTVTVTGTNTFTVIDTVSGVTSGDCRWDIRDLNISTTATVINPTTLTYFSPGAQVATTTSTEGRLDLGGLVQSRNYLYTWYTPWDEESVGSEPSTAIFIKEGQIVTITGLPTAPPAGDNFIRGIRLYRTLSAAQTLDAEYFRLQTLWFPQGIASVARSGGVVTLKFAEQHKFIDDDRFKLAGCSVAGFDITGGVVTDVPDRFTITYAQAGSDVATTAATGTVYYDIAEDPPTDPARYWGDGSYDFTDDFNYRSLLNILESGEYDAPPADLAGLTVTQSNIMVGFVGNDLYFTEPGKFHAWPVKYKISLEYNIVGLVALGGDLLVMTEGFPYALSGSDPAILTTTRYSTNYPCLSKRSIVQTDVGVMYATHEGLALASFTGGVQIVTAPAHSPDTWNLALNPSTIAATFYDSMYFGSHSTGAFFYRRTQDGQTPGDFVDYDLTFTATWFDPISGFLYYVSGVDGDIIRWDDPAQPNSDYTWKSKVFISQVPFNMGAARVVGDYIGVMVSPVWSEYDVDWEDADITWDVAEPVTFKLYANKSLVFTTTRGNSDVFRLPAGYKTDTYEIEVNGNVRIRSVHLGETPTSLARS